MSLGGSAKSISVLWVIVFWSNTALPQTFGSEKNPLFTTQRSRSTVCCDRLQRTFCWINWCKPVSCWSPHCAPIMINQNAHLDTRVLCVWDFTQNCPKPYLDYQESEIHQNSDNEVASWCWWSNYFRSPNIITSNLACVPRTNKGINVWWRGFQLVV